MKAQVTTVVGTVEVSLDRAKEWKELYGWAYTEIVKCPNCGEDHPRGEYGMYCGLDCSVDHLREHERKDYFNETDDDNLNLKR